MYGTCDKITVGWILWNMSVHVGIQEMFSGTQQQDAHEFLNYLMNAIADELTEQQKQLDALHPPSQTQSNEKAETVKPAGSTWIQELFQGTLENETTCLGCNTVRLEFGLFNDRLNSALILNNDDSIAI